MCGLVAAWPRFNSISVPTLSMNCISRCVQFSWARVRIYLPVSTWQNSGTVVSNTFPLSSRCMWSLQEIHKGRTVVNTIVLRLAARIASSDKSSVFWLERSTVEETQTGLSSAFDRRNDD